MTFQEQQYSSSGPRFSFGPGALSPFIKWMLIINCGVFVLQSVLPDEFTQLLALSTGAFFHGFPNYIYQLFTYMFLHAGFFHLLFNMFMLWMFGTEIEFTWGSRSFGVFYLLAGLSGGILSLITHEIFSASPVFVLGASGAIYGVLIAYWLMFPDRLLYLYFLFPVKVKWAIPGLLALGFLTGGRGVAHMAHLGGALFGFIYMKSDWRFVSLSRRLKTLRYRRQEAKLEKRRQEAEDVMKRVDAILDKINEVGIENLTKAERKFLEEASSELSRRSD